MEAMELLRRVYVDAAEEDEFKLPGRKNSDTRIAILTGLSRKEVNRLRTSQGEGDLETNLGSIGRLVAAWNQDPDFTGPYGLPLALPFSQTSAKDSPTFMELASKHSPGLSPKDMLDELLRTGLAHVDEDGLIRNSGRTYIPSKLDPAAIERLGQVVSRLADTLDFNNQVEDSTQGRYERQVITDIGLTEEQYRQFNIYLRSKCQQLLEMLDNWLATQEGRLNEVSGSEAPLKERLITGVGVFHFLDEESGKSDASPGDSKDEELGK